MGRPAHVCVCAGRPRQQIFRNRPSVELRHKHVASAEDTDHPKTRERTTLAAVCISLWVTILTAAACCALFREVAWDHVCARSVLCHLPHCSLVNLIHAEDAEEHTTSWGEDAMAGDL